MYGKCISIRSPHTRGDWCRRAAAKQPKNFNPLPSHDGRRCGTAHPVALCLISIRSPHTRGDIIQVQPPTGEQKDFNPLPSHEGRRGAALFIPPVPTYFNPLPSHEGRRVYWVWSMRTARFQSAPLTRGETRAPDRDFMRRKISIRSPHTRGD